MRLLDSFEHAGPHGRHVCMVFEARPTFPLLPWLLLTMRFAAASLWRRRCAPPALFAGHEGPLCDRTPAGPKQWATHGHGAHSHRVLDPSFLTSHAG